MSPSGDIIKRIVELQVKAKVKVKRFQEVKVKSIDFCGSQIKVKWNIAILLLLSDSNSASDQTAQLPQSLKCFKFLAVKIASQQAQQPPSATDAGMQQLNQYLTEVQLVNSRSGNPVSALDFWKSKTDLCDKLAPVALDIVAAPASQAYVARLFSVCGLLTDGCKNQMSKSLEMRVCLKLNKKVLCAIDFL